MLRAFLKKLPGLDDTRVLEVACGDGCLTKDLLHEWFKKIDLFDQCPKAIAKVNLMKESINAIENVELADMISFKFQHTYSAIILRWCIGYLNERQLVDFLMRAKYWLKKDKKRLTRQKGFVAYIIVFDNVASDGRQYKREKG